MRHALEEQFEHTAREAAAAGLRRPSPRHVAPVGSSAKPSELQRLARRLHRRAQGMKPAAIARLETNETGDYCDPVTVEGSVHDWSRDLQVTPPPLRRRRRMP